MKVLVSELSDKEIEQRIESLEKYLEKLRNQMNIKHTAYNKHILFKKWDVSLNMYADVIYEAAYRKLITIH